MTPIRVFIHALQRAFDAANLKSTTLEMLNPSTDVVTLGLQFLLGTVECAVAVMETHHQGRAKPIKSIFPRKYRTLKPVNITFRLDHEWPMVDIYARIVRLEGRLKAIHHDTIFGFTIESGLSADEAQALSIHYTEYVREGDMDPQCEPHRSAMLAALTRDIVHIGERISEWFEEESSSSRH